MNSTPETRARRMNEAGRKARRAQWTLDSARREWHTARSILEHRGEWKIYCDDRGICTTADFGDWIC